MLIRALGIGTNAEILELFGEEPKLLATLTKDTSESYQEGLLELYKKIRPGRAAGGGKRGEPDYQHVF